MATDEDVLIEARAELRRRSPFLDFVLERIDLWPTAAVPTARLRFVPSRFVIDYNPAYLAPLTPSQRAAVLEHELRHLLHRHLDRQGERDTRRWNTACDFAINADIFDLPPDALRPPRRFRGKQAEAIYDGLGSEPTPVAGCFYHPLPSDLRRLLPRIHGWLLGEARRRFGRALVAEELARLAAQTPGTDEERLVGAAANLDIDWIHILNRFARPRTRRPTLQRPSRRLPSPWGKQRERRPRVVAALDTSGSISTDLGAIFVAELHRLRAHCLSLIVIMADAAVQAVISFEELAGRSFAGRGGTDFSAAIAYVNTHFADHDLLLYLTDGHGQVPSTPAAIPLVWIITDNRQFPGSPAFFARSTTVSAPPGSTQP